MTKPFRYLVLIVGLLSPILALWLYSQVYTTLTQASTNREQDWLFRLAMSGLAMTVPFLLTVFLAWLGWRQQRQQLPGAATTRSEKRRQQRTAPPPKSTVPLAAKIGLVVATLSLLLLWKPIGDGSSRWKQVHNLAMHDVTAPAFDTLDIDGKPQRLADHKGQVVVVNIWATWCGPCRAEMPALDRMYQQQKEPGACGVRYLQRRRRFAAPVPPHSAGHLSPAHDQRASAQPLPRYSEVSGDVPDRPSRPSPACSWSRPAISGLAGSRGSLAECRVVSMLIARCAAGS